MSGSLPGLSMNASPELGREAPPRSRRALLAAAVGGLGAWVAAAATRVNPASAAAGSSLIMGSETNTAGTGNTQLAARSDYVGLKVLQYSPSTALMGYVSSTVANADARGVYGRTNSPNSDGVQGRNAGAAGTGAGVRAFGGNNPGLIATSTSADSTATGVSGTADAGAGVRGNSTNNYGVYGTGGYCGARGQGGTYGAISSGTSVGSYGSGSDYGLYGAGGSYGLYAGGTTYGVYGSGPTGVRGSGSTYGVLGSTTNLNTDAVRGDGGQYGVRGLNARTAGTRGDSGYVGAWGQANLYGVYGLATDGAATSYGVFGQASNNASYGVWCQGNMHVTGTLSKAAGSFKIDHPLDPEHRWLSHSFIESPDMMNVYNGIAVLDAAGKATVKLPDYFEALNRDFRYQLTAIGGAAPSLHVSGEVRKNAFSIAGGAAGQKVSWQVTGIRQDDYAKAHPIVVETNKSATEKGKRQFVPHGSNARAMKVGPAQPDAPSTPTPSAVPEIVTPRSA
jgi:hypothetical protein